MTTDLTPQPVTAGTDPDRLVVAVAWPTGRPIYAYTVDELADGVDVYTRWLKTSVKAGEADAF